MTATSTILISLISITILWVGLFWLYRDYCIDLFRQRMFALRDELFDQAAKGAIPFNHKSYGMLRVSMNGFIRFAHDFSLAHFLFVVLRQHKDEGLRYSERFNGLVQGLDENSEENPSIHRL